MAAIKVFEKNGVYRASPKDDSPIIGIEMEFMYTPSVNKRREHADFLRPITKNHKPSLIQLRKGMRDYFLYQIEWFVNAEEDGFLDELVFVPMSIDLLKALKEDISDMLLRIMLAQYTVESPTDKIGMHNTIDIGDMTSFQFYKMCTLFPLLKDIIYKIARREYLSTEKSDLDFSIGDAWNNLTEREKIRKYTAFVDILVSGFQKKIETTLLNTRVYPDGRPLFEIMWYNSTFDVDQVLLSAEFSLSLKQFSMANEEVSRLNYINFIVEYRHNFPYLHAFILNECEEFSLTRILNNEVRIIQ